MEELYRYKVVDWKVVDADTIDLYLDTGFRHYFWDRYRLYGPDPDGQLGLDAPERFTEAGKSASLYLASILANIRFNGGTLIARTVKDREDKFGRYLAVLYGHMPTNVVNVNQYMVDSGHAVLKRY